MEHNELLKGVNVLMEKHLKFLLIMSICFVTVFSASLPAFAWAPWDTINNLGNCSYKHRSTSTTTAVRNAFNQAASDWNSAVSGVDFYEYNNSANEVYALNIVGALERGANLFSVQVGTATVPTEDPDKTMEVAKFTRFSTYINIAYSPGTNAYRSTANHEFGHVLGLDHETRRAVLMNGNRNVETIYKAQADDKNGVRIIWEYREEDNEK